MYPLVRRRVNNLKSRMARHECLNELGFVNPGIIEHYDDLTRHRIQHVLEKRHDTRAFNTPND